MIISYMSWQAVFYIFGASATLWLPFWFTANIPKQKAPETASLPALETEDRPAPVSSDLEDRSASSQVVELPSTDTDQLIDRRQAAASTEIAALPHTSEFARILGSMGMDSGFIALTKRKEVWAICAAQYCNSWGAYALLNWLPTYFSEQVRNSSSHTVHVLGAGITLHKKYVPRCLSFLCTIGNWVLIQLGPYNAIGCVQYNVGLDQLGEYTVLPPLAQVITGVLQRCSHKICMCLPSLLLELMIQKASSVVASNFICALPTCNAGSISGLIADYLIQQGYSVKAVRRYLQVGSHPSIRFACLRLSNGLAWIAPRVDKSDLGARAAHTCPVRQLQQFYIV